MSGLVGDIRQVQVRNKCASSTIATCHDDTLVSGADYFGLNGVRAFGGIVSVMYIMCMPRKIVHCSDCQWGEAVVSWPPQHRRNISRGLYSIVIHRLPSCVNTDSHGNTLCLNR